METKTRRAGKSRGKGTRSKRAAKTLNKPSLFRPTGGLESLKLFSFSTPESAPPKPFNPIELWLDKFAPEKMELLRIMKSAVETPGLPPILAFAGSMTCLGVLYSAMNETGRKTQKLFQ